MEKIQSGQFAQVHYTGKLSDGTVFDTSEGREPWRFRWGAATLSPVSTRPCRTWR